MKFISLSLFILFVSFRIPQLSLIVVLNNNQCECGVFSIIRDILQWNVAGIPIIHQNVEYDFNPEVSQKRREQFYEVMIN